MLLMTFFKIQLKMSTSGTTTTMDPLIPAVVEEVRKGNAKWSHDYREKKMGAGVEDPVERQKIKEKRLLDQAAAKKLYRAKKKAKDKQQKNAELQIENSQLRHANRELASQLPMVLQTTNIASTEPPEQQSDQPTVSFQLLTDAQRERQQAWLIDFIQLPEADVCNYTDEVLQLKYANNWQAYKELMAIPGKQSTHLCQCMSTVP